MINKENLRKVSLAIAMALVFCAPLCIGSVHPPVIIVQSLLATFAVALIVFTSSDKKRLVPYSVLGFGLLGFFSVLQVIPLPSWLVSVIAPKSFEIWQGMERTLGIQKNFYSISVDPPGTTLEATRYIGLASLSLLWASLVSLYGAKVLRFAVWAVVISALFAICVGILSMVLTPDRIFFFYSPLYLPKGKWGFLTTFVNGNHQASFFGLSALCALGLFFRVKSRLKKIFLGLALIAFVGVLLVTGSVAGLVIFSFLALVSLLVRALTRRNETGVFPKVLLVFTALLTVFALVLALYPNAPRLLAPPPGTHSLDIRFTVWASALHLLKRFWLAGAGGGAAGAVLTETNPIPNLVFYHLENQWLEIVLEYGAIVGTVSIGLILINLVLAFPGLKGRTLQIAVFAGLCGLCLHNLVDFNFAFNGTSIPFASLLGAQAAVVASHGNHKGKRYQIFLPIGVQRIVGICAVGVVLFFAFRPLGRTIIEERDITDLENAQIHHPAWFFPAFRLAYSFQMQNDVVSSRKWVDFARQRAPNFLNVTALVVRQMLIQGEFAEAKEAFSRLWLHKDFLSRHLLFAFTIPQASEAIPQLSSLFTPEDEEFWAIVKYLEQANRPDVGEKVLRLAFKKHNYHPRVAFALGSLYLKFGKVTQAEDVGFLTMAEHPEAPQGYYLLGLARMQKNAYWHAYHLLLDALRFAPNDLDLLSTFVNCAMIVGELDSAEEFARKMLGVCSSKSECLNARNYLSHALEKKGDLKGALRVLEGGETLAMDTIWYLERMASLAIKAKNVSRAIYLLRRILSIDPMNQKAKDMLEKILK